MNAAFWAESEFRVCVCLWCVCVWGGGRVSEEDEEAVGRGRESRARGRKKRREEGKRLVWGKGGRGEQLPLEREPADESKTDVFPISVFPNFCPQRRSHFRSLRLLQSVLETKKIEGTARGARRCPRQRVEERAVFGIERRRRASSRNRSKAFPTISKSAAFGSGISLAQPRKHADVTRSYVRL